MAGVVIALAGLAAGLDARSDPALRPGEVRRGEAAARIDEYLTRLVPYGFSGAVLVASGDELVLKKAYGLANRTTGTPYTVDMVSSIGSVTKQFTGAAIVKLETMGRLSTDDPIAKFLPDVPADKRGITIHHLLTHTAGFPRDSGGADDEPIARDALVAHVLAAPLAAPPGERFEYSNEGYTLAGAIIERVSGMGYEAFLREHLFLPAGMHDTGYVLPRWPLERLPIGYGADGAEWGRVHRRNWLPDGPGWWLRANGGIHSTLDDLYRWHRALDSTVVLPAGALKKYLTGHVPAEGEERYAYGWGVQPTRRGTTVVAHNGGNGFFSADFRRYVDDGVVVIAMTNRSAIPAAAVAPRQIEALYFNDAPVVMPPAGVPVPRASRETLAGTYASPGGHIRVALTDDGLTASADDPLMFGTLGAIAPAGGRFAALEEATRPLVSAAVAGDVGPTVAAMRFEMPERAEQARGNLTRTWGQWRDQLGDEQGIEILGTATVQGDPAVTARVRYARGARVVQFIWGPRRLAGFRAVPADPVTLVAEAPDVWVFYSYRLPSLVRLVFDEGTVTVEGPQGSVIGRREGGDER
jgi:CubicO group peptidase (beta-lactamase class C family)